MKLRRELKVIIWAVIILAIIFASSLIRMYTDWLWFGEVGYRPVFWTQILYKLLLGISAAILFFAIVYANIRIAGDWSPEGCTGTQTHPAEAGWATLRAGELAESFYLAQLSPLSL
jgi:uncharacterized membrane protein (UPF0182 family)